MADNKPGADELRMRAILRQRQVGPDAVMPPVAPPVPKQRQRDWLDDIIDTPVAEPVEEPAEPVPGPRWWQRNTAADPAPDEDPDVEDQDEEPNPDAESAPEPAPRPRPAAPQRARYTPRLSLLDAYDRVSPRLRWLAYHATAAAAGWRFGLVDWATHTAAWYAQGHWISPSAWALYLIGGCCLSLYRRTRGWAWPIAWAAAIPASSIVTGVLLYGSGA